MRSTEKGALVHGKVGFGLLDKHAERGPFAVHQPFLSFGPRMCMMCASARRKYLPSQRVRWLVVVV